MMAYTYLALDTGLIPDSTKENVPTYSASYFSSDGSRLLLPGYNEDRHLVHKHEVLLQWLQWEAYPEATLQTLLDTALELTLEELKSARQDPESIWYAVPEVE